MLNKFQQILLTILFIFPSSIIYAAAPTLLVTEKFIVISVNGKNFSSSIFESQAKVNLNKGINKIALKYKELFESNDDDDDHTVIDSDIFVIQMFIDKDQTYKLRYLRPMDASAARRYAREPIVSIVNQQGKNINVENIYLAAQSRGFVNQATRINTTSQTMINLTSPNKIVNTATANTDSSKPKAGQMLIFWWDQADEKQRKAFLEQIREE